jgi:PAS domain S-box-containing protein
VRGVSAISAIHDIAGYRAEQNFSTLLEAAPCAMAIVDSRGHIVLANARTEQLFGYTRGELLETSVELLLPEQLRAKHSAHRDGFFANPRVGVGLELLGRRKDGVEFSIEVSLSPLETAQGILALAAIRDISERKQFEAALRQSEQRFRDIAQISGDWIWETGPDHRIAFLAADRLDGSLIPPKTILGMTRWELAGTDPEEEEQWARHKADLEAHRPFRDFRYALTTSTGKPIHVCVNGKPLFDDTGNFCGYLGTTTDETAIVEARQRAEQAEEKLNQAQKMEAIGQLTGGLAHDFNNILTAMIATLDLFRQIYLGRVPEAQPLLESALNAAQRGAGLIRSLLAFARRQTLQPETIDVNKLVGHMTELLQRSLGESIIIETRLGDGLWRTFVDPNQLESALLNLTVNARDAMPQGGKLTIETSNTYLDDPAASDAEVAPGPYIMIAVSDNGTGMSEEVGVRIFEPFFTTKPEGHGTGLGLSQVYGFVKQSGGHVKASSEIGAGTTVKVYLPRTQAEPSTEILTPWSSHPMLGNQETILLVEDNDEVRQLTAQALRLVGYRVREAAEAATALNLLEQHPEIALLFTDVGLPGMNGGRLAEEAARRKPGLKVLFTTAYGRDAIAHQGVLDPDVPLIGKPYRVEDLARKMRQILTG